MTSPLDLRPQVNPRWNGGRLGGVDGSGATGGNRGVRLGPKVRDEAVRWI